MGSNRKSSWFWLRVGIVFLRIIPIWAALFGVAALCDFATGAPWTKGLIQYSAPLQKRFFAPTVYFISSLLVLIPFIALRSAIVFRVYATLFLGCLVFMAYDCLIPFRYVAPNSADAGSGLLCRFWVTDGQAHWESEPRFDDLWTYLPFIGTMILAFIYRRYFLRWAANPEQDAAVGLRGAEEVSRDGTHCRGSSQPLSFHVRRLSHYP